MRIEVDGSPVTNVTLFLKAAEASELRDAMNDMCEQPGRSWHAHVGSGDYQTEITVAFEDESA